MNKIYIISTNRSDYGAIHYVLKEALKQELNHEFLDYRFLQDHKNIDIAFFYVMEKFMLDLKKKKIKNIFLLGDRWETLLIAMIAKVNNVTIFHQGGGEISTGSYDDNIRHAISNLADYHFVINQKCKIELNNQGITDNIFMCGSPRLDFDFDNIKQKKFKKKTALVIYHPTTKNNNAYNEITIVIDSLRYFDMNYIIIYPNLDKESEIIIKELKEFAFDDRVKLKKSFKLNIYLELLKSVDVMIGNSSSGIIETASFGLPTVNIGDRQNNRDCNNNVIHVKCDKHEIIQGIQKALTSEFKEICKNVKNKFKANSSYKMLSEMKRIIK